MNSEDYKIDAHSIDEKMMMAKSRSEWEADIEQHRSNISYHEETWKMMMGLNADAHKSAIENHKEKIAYIEEVLDRWYSDMCIRCAHKTPVATYCGQANCMNCMKNIIYRVIGEMNDEERADFEERLDKQLELKGE